jgi:hypothetical protein
MPCPRPRGLTYMRLSSPNSKLRTIAPQPIAWPVVAHPFNESQIGIAGNGLKVDQGLDHGDNLTGGSHVRTSVYRII